MTNLKIGIIGLGIVGNAMYQVFLEKKYILNKNLFVYDKFKNTPHTESRCGRCCIFLSLSPNRHTFNQDRHNLFPYLAKV